MVHGEFRCQVDLSARLEVLMLIRFGISFELTGLPEIDMFSVSQLPDGTWRGGWGAFQSVMMEVDPRGRGGASVGVHVKKWDVARLGNLSRISRGSRLRCLLPVCVLNFGLSLHFLSSIFCHCFWQRRTSIYRYLRSERSLVTR